MKTERRDHSLLGALNKHTAKTLMGVNTALPGIVQSYDPDTRRASILPGVKTVMQDGTSASKPMLHDVPVVMPSGGGYSLTLPLAEGDPVLVVFCQRGIGEFKKTLEEAEPTLAGLFPWGGAIAIAGIAPLDATDRGEGVTMQHTESGARVSAGDGMVKVSAGGTDVEVEVASGAITLNGDLTVNGEITATGGVTATGDVTGMGVSLATHRHPGVTPGPGMTAPPVPG